jgi:nitrite reductase (cytochrome c-552)
VGRYPPLTNINRVCQQCHHYPEQEILKRVETIQDRHYALLTRAGNALVDMLDAIKAAKQANATEAQLAPILELQRQAQWRLDFVAAENSMGFHALQELARILGESIDMSRQAQLAAASLKVTLAQAAPAGVR